MIDNEMNNILQNLKNVGTNNASINPTTGEAGAPKTDNKAMFNILSKFDDIHPLSESQDPGQKKAGQLDPTFKPKNISPVQADGSTKHPMQGKMVGESGGDSNWGDELIEDLKLLVQEIQEYGMSVPDVINGITDTIQKYSGSEEPSDRDLENDWDQAMGEDRVEEETLSKKQSLADVLRSIEETEEEISNRLTKEFHSKSEPKKGPGRTDTGTFQLAEVIKLLNAYKGLNENFDWEPQPEYAGVSVKHDERKFSQRDVTDKLQKMWIGLLRDYKTSKSGSNRKEFMQQIRKVASVAERNQVSLNPTPRDIGLKA